MGFIFLFFPVYFLKEKRKEKRERKIKKKSERREKG